MDKFSFISLWDAYNALLTKTQQEITDLYFNLDLTVSEIAAEKGISRQAVSDCLKSCKSQLEEYEEKLHFLGRVDKINGERSSKAEEVKTWAQSFMKAHPEYSNELQKLIGILY